MIKSFVSSFFGFGINMNITAVWDRVHPHLRPNASFKQKGSADVYTVFANVRFGKDRWVELMEIEYRKKDDQFWISDTAYADAIQNDPDIGRLKVEAVDARLWSATPTLINIEPTTRCNFNCWYCVGRHMKQADIRVEDFEAMLDNFHGLRTIALVGEGEPLMHKDFFTMARMAKARGIRVMIISNGSAFSASVIKQLCEEEIAYVAISIDSADPETFASSRLDGDLEKVWRGIRKLRDYRDENGYVYPKISLKGTLFSDTKTELPSIVDAAIRNGVEVFESFQPLNPMKNYVRIYPKEKLQELAVIDEVVQSAHADYDYATSNLQPFREFCQTEGIDLFPTTKANPKFKNCDETWIYSLLSGDVTPCCQIKDPPNRNWNIFNRNIADILDDPDYESLRFNLWNGIFPDYCEGCWKTR